MERVKAQFYQNKTVPYANPEQQNSKFKHIFQRKRTFVRIMGKKDKMLITSIY